ncbi:hypothetical protein FFF34_000920 [Inquilinus sp. KBS0705]|nr:hypothetical protein FFF34_000920 [Inquilinus sp. KBS0705]
MTTTVAEPAVWSGPRKVAVRFATIFFTLYVLLEPNGVLPYMDVVYNYYIIPINKLIVWTASHIFHTGPVSFEPTGSGDTLRDYITYFLILAFAFIGALIWSLADRRARNYNNMFYWLTVIVRYYVAFTMISYGGVKVIKLQFAGPTPDRLLQTYGNSSPMGLAWTYMGFSDGFNYFTGMGELTCGLLLLFRKTATLGAVVGLVVAANIMAVNYCFDVPVKLLSTMLTLMCLFLLSKDAIRLVNFFFLNKTAQPANLSPHTFKKRWKNVSLTTVKYLLIAYTLYANISGDISAMSQYGDAAPKPPLYGIYNVQSFVRNNDTIPPLATDTARWHKLTVSYSGGARVIMMNDSIKRYDFKIDTLKHTIVMNTYIDTLTKGYYTYTQPNKDVLLLKGKFHQDSLHIRLNRYDLKNFRLLNRGFHWVNEQAFNR